MATPPIAFEYRRDPPAKQAVSIVVYCPKCNKQLAGGPDLDYLFGVVADHVMEAHTMNQDRAQLFKVQGELNQAQLDLATTNKHLMDARDYISKLSRDKAELRDLLDDAKGRIKDLETSNQVLRANLDAKDHDTSDYRVACTKAHEALTDAGITPQVGNLWDRVGALVKQRDEATRKAEGLEKELKGTRDIVEWHKMEMKPFVDSVEDSHKALREARVVYGGALCFGVKELIRERDSARKEAEIFRTRVKQLQKYPRRRRTVTKSNPIIQRSYKPRQVTHQPPRP